MKSKIIAVTIAAFMLASCGGGVRPLTPTRTEYRVAMPENTYFECKRIELPDPETLTDVQIASLINDLVRENRTCVNNMQAIRQFLIAARQILESNQ